MNNKNKNVRTDCVQQSLPAVSKNEVFALLDDNNASTALPSSRLYTGFVRVHTCFSVGEFDEMLLRMQRAIESGLYAVGLFTYELGIQSLGAVQNGESLSSEKPLAQILLFARCDHLSANAVTDWLGRFVPPGSHANPDRSTIAGVANVVPEIDRAAFGHAIDRIHAYIEAGDVYQVNYTYRLRFEVYGSAMALYRQLRKRQPVPYGALIALPDGQTVLSFSPELLIRHDAGKLTARPMKGTAPATANRKVDARSADALAADAKNRAENLMIVDLLRNDLGRIAGTGSVTVPSLFDVSRYGNVLQMTSTVCAMLRADATLPEVFSAVFPCGSIAGAPKRRSMQIIDELETSVRGLYTGAIGWFDRSQGAQGIGNFALSVPIRTLLLEAPSREGNQRGEMGIGAGIVHDSVAQAEYEECQLKASFLTAAPPAFDLFETLYATQQDGYRHLERHLQRLCRSATCFGFTCNVVAIQAALETARLTLTPEKPYRVRLTLAFDGICIVHSTPLAPLAPVVGLLLASEPVAIDKLFLRHKTTFRTQYDQAWQKAEAHGAFDMLFFNAHGELTEGARSNVFLKLDGRWTTPPLKAGVLPGVMRSVLLDDPHWQAVEQRLTLKDLERAEKIVLCNALRGVLEAHVIK